jgi:hypothetical protein
MLDTRRRQMAEKTKLKWLRKEFSSSEELEYYLTQLKHQDKLKSDIISLLERFQHLLFADYEPDVLTITYNGHWDITFGATSSESALNEEIKIKKEKPATQPEVKATVKKAHKTPSNNERGSKSKSPAPIGRINLKALLEAELLPVGARLKYKNRPSIVATVTRDGHLKIGKTEYQSLSGAATSFVPAGRRDGWLCWLFQDQDGDWKPIDLLRDRWRQKK